MVERAVEKIYREEVNKEELRLIEEIIREESPVAESEIIREESPVAESKPNEIFFFKNFLL